MKFPQTFCKNCNYITEYKDGWYGKKCCQCDAIVNPNKVVNRIILITVVLFIIQLFLFIGLASALPVDITPFSSNPANGSTVNNRIQNLGWNITVENISSICFTRNISLACSYDDSLIFGFNFNNNSLIGEGQSIFTDITGRNNATGYNLTGYTFVNGKYNKAIEFNGSYASYLNITTMNNYNWSLPHSVAFWFKPKDINGGVRYGILTDDISSTNKNFQLDTIGQTVRYFYFVNGTGTENSVNSGTILNITTSDYVFIVAEIDRGTGNFTVYANGQFVNSSLMATNVSALGTVRNLQVGGIRSGTQHELNGSIDNLMFYNKTLSATEVYELYKSDLEKYNNSIYQFSYNDTLTGISNYNYFLNVNDTSSNVKNSSLIIRLLYNLIFKSNTIGLIHDYFYGVSMTTVRWLGGDAIDTNGDGSYDTPTNITWHKDKFVDSNLNIVRMDMKVQNYYSNQTTLTNGVNYTGGIENGTAQVSYLKSQGKKIMLIADFMPQWLADNSTGLCSDLQYCSAYNNTIWSNIILDAYYRYGCDSDSCIVEVWNEPYLNFFMGNLGTDDYNKSLKYISMYNTLYTILKQNDSNIQVGGPSGYRDAPNMTKQFLDNATAFDFVSIHPYDSSSVSSNKFLQLNDTRNIITLCSTFGVFCPNIYFTEWDVGSATLQNTSSLESQYGSLYAQSINSILNNFPSNVTMITHDWSSRYKYDAHLDGDYPFKYYLVSEPNLDNDVRLKYNLTSGYSRYASAGSTVYNCSVDNSEVQCVATITSGGACSISLTSIVNDQTNISLSLPTQCSNLVDTSNQVNLVNTSSVALSSYGVKFLTTPYYSVQSNGYNATTNYLGEILGLSANPISITPFASNPANGSTVNNRYQPLGFNFTSDNQLDTFIFNFNNTNTTIFDNSILLWWQMNNLSALQENDLVVTDISKYGYNATVNGSAVWGINFGKYNGGFNFDGTNDFIERKVFNRPNEITISFWLNYSGQGASVDSDIVRMPNYLTLETYGASNTSVLLSFRNKSGTSFQIAPITNFNNLSIWNNFIFTVNSTRMTIYKNGIELKAMPFNGTLNSSTDYIQLMTENTGKFIKGGIDDFVIFNRSLSEDEVKTFYSTSLVKYNSSLYGFSNNKTTSNLRYYNSFLFVNDTLSNFNISIANSIYINYVSNVFSSFNSPIGTVRNDFYGVQAGDVFSEFNNVSTTNSCSVLDSISNYTKERNDYSSAGFKTSRKDMNLAFSVGLDGRVNKSADWSNLKWAYQNNKSILMIAKGTPSFLANLTSPEINCSSDVTTCIPTNYTQWCSLILNYLNNVTEYGRYNSAVSGIEVWNEPESNSYFLSGLGTGTDNMTIRSKFYNVLYNNTYWCIKNNATYSNLPVGGPAVSSLDVGQGQTFLDRWLGNFSNQMQFVSFHDYHYSATSLTDVAETVTYVYSRCAVYGANCSRIILGEWNMNNATEMFGVYQGMFTAINLQSMLNNFSSNLTQALWKFDIAYSNWTCDSSRAYVMYSQFNTTQQQGYNVISKYSRYNSANSIVQYSYTDDSDAQPLANKLSQTCSYTLINKVIEPKNVSVSFDSTLCGNILMDTSNGQLISNGSTIVLSEYDVRYLTDPQATYQNGNWYWTNYLLEPIRLMTQAEISQYATTNPVTAVNDNGFAKTVLNILLGIFSIGIVGVALLFLKYWYDEGELTGEKIVTITIALILALVFIRVLADVINAL